MAERKTRAIFLLFLLTVLLIPTRLCRADMIGYGERVTVVGKNDKFTAVHYHDWSYRTRDERYAILDYTEQIFSPTKNHFAYLKLFDKSTGKLVFRTPVPALTYLWISPDSKFVVGLSNVKLWNPYQLVVFTIDGKLLHQERITSEVVMMTQEETNEFFRKFPASKTNLLPLTRTYQGKQYIDAFSGGVPGALNDDAWRQLCKFVHPHPYSPNFRESVSNYVTWFDRENPQLELQQTETGVQLSLRDPKCQTFYVPLPDVPSEEPVAK